MENIYLERLKKLKEFLFEIDETTKPSPPQLIIVQTKDGDKEYYYHKWVFDLWSTVDLNFNERNEKIGKFLEEQNVFNSNLAVVVLSYFNLEEEDFLTLFGTKSNETVQACRIAHRIRAYIEYKENYRSDLYRERLLKFADFIDGQKDPEGKEICTVNLRASHDLFDKNKVSVALLYWVFTFLPDCFDEEWYIDSSSEYNQVIYGPSEGGDTISSLFVFFNLNGPNELSELFGVNDHLSEQSTCKQIAENIVRWVKARKV